MITIQVDPDRCQNYGQCVLQAPDLFQLNDQGRLRYQASADSSGLDEVEAAADICPMQAISFVDQPNGATP